MGFLVLETVKPSSGVPMLWFHLRNYIFCFPQSKIRYSIFALTVQIFDAEATMEAYSMPYEVRWTDIDANRHVRYSAYIDAASELRYRYFTHFNLPPEAFDNLGVGPVYTALNATFFREVRLGETLTITFQLAGLSPQGMRWKFHHDFFKANHKKAVTVTLEGTLLDLATRQPACLTPEIMQVFQQMPRSSNFEQMSESRWFR
jgi:acyl-CoA thioester hydrolase